MKYKGKEGRGSHFGFQMANEDVLEQYDKLK